MTGVCTDFHRTADAAGAHAATQCSDPVTIEPDCCVDFAAVQCAAPAVAVVAIAALTAP